MGEALLINNTAGSALGLAATDTTLISGVVKANQYKSVRISSSVEVNTTGTATARTVTLKIKIGSTVLATRAFLTVAAIQQYNVAIEYVTNTAAANDSIGAGGTITVAAIGSAADAAQTTLTAKNLYITSVE